MKGRDPGADVETFTPYKEIVANPGFGEQRRKQLDQMDPAVIDPPIKDLIQGFSKISYCFTIQSCCGHFLYKEQQNPRNVERLLPCDPSTPVEYRLAYIAFCVDDSDRGRTFLRAVEDLCSIDPAYIQFGCAEWFWQRQVNSYALQVEPWRYRDKDRTTIQYEEACHLESVRDKVFDRMRGLIHERLVEQGNTS